MCVGGGGGRERERVGEAKSGRGGDCVGVRQACLGVRVGVCACRCMCV